MAAVILRPYQQDLLERVVDSPSPTNLVVLPTGTGKTPVGVALMDDARRNGMRALWLTNREELIDGLFAHLVADGVDGEQISVIRSGDLRYRDDACFYIASVQTLARRDLVIENVGRIIVDEAQHTPADSYAKILARYPSALVTGLTATPTRLDGKSLAPFYGALLEGPSPDALIDGGYLGRPRIWMRGAPDMSRVKRRDGEFNRAASEDAMKGIVLGGDVVRDWLRYAEGLPTICFALSVAHANALANQFADTGVSAEVLDSKTPPMIRAGVFDRMRSGESKVLVNCEILVEGVDLPFVRCVSLARPTLSLALHMQMIGRGLRPGDVAPILLDHAGNFARHPVFCFDWDLETGRPKQTSGATGRKCKTCGLRVDAGEKVCPSCGAVFVGHGRRADADEDGTELVECVVRNRESLAQVVARIGVAEGVTLTAIRGRLKWGWPIEKAVTLPIGAQGPENKARTSQHAKAVDGTRAMLVRRNGHEGSVWLRRDGQFYAQLPARLGRHAVGKYATRELAIAALVAEIAKRDAPTTTIDDSSNCAKSAKAAPPLAD